MPEGLKPPAGKTLIGANIAEAAKSLRSLAEATCALSKNWDNYEAIVLDILV